MFSASQSGFSTIEIYDLGPLNKIDLSIAKAGLEDTGGTVTFSVEQSLLDSLNNADGTSYQLLPPECYTIENATYSVSPGGDRRVTGAVWCMILTKSTTCAALMNLNTFFHYGYPLQGLL